MAEACADIAARRSVWAQLAGGAKEGVVGNSGWAGVVQQMGPQNKFPQMQREVVLNLAGNKPDSLLRLAVDSGILGTCVAYLQRSSATIWTFVEISRGSKRREV
jgi:hypothetical protein